MAYLSYCVFFLALLIASLCVWLTVANSFATHTEKLSSLEVEGELVFVHVLYRHGDRNPILATPGSQYSDISHWPEGWGQLTTLGVKQEFALGQWFRRRFSNYLSGVYNVNDIYVQSSDVDRTLMRAKSTLAGLYPAIGNKVWNNNILWQPIPVHTMPVETDYLIAGEVPPTCSSYQDALNEYMVSDEMQKFKKTIQPFFDYLTTSTGVKIDSLHILSLMRDTWLCETVHNYTLPRWVDKLYPDNEEFAVAALKMYQLYTGTKFMAKFRTGFLLKDILDRFTLKTQDSLSPNRKLWMYSSHDLTVFSVLRSMDLLKDDYVPYATAITMELRKYENEHYVQIFYRNSTRERPEPIMIPGCGTACPLSKMYEIYDDLIPKNDFDTECQIPEYKETLVGPS